MIRISSRNIMMKRDTEKNFWILSYCILSVLKIQFTDISANFALMAPYGYVTDPIHVRSYDRIPCTML